MQWMTWKRNKRQDNIIMISAPQTVAHRNRPPTMSGDASQPNVPTQTCKNSRPTYAIMTPQLYTYGSLSWAKHRMITIFAAIWNDAKATPIKWRYSKITWWTFYTAMTVITLYTLMLHNYKQLQIARWLYLINVPWLRFEIRFHVNACRRSEKLIITCSFRTIRLSIRCGSFNHFRIRIVNPFNQVVFGDRITNVTIHEINVTSKWEFGFHKDTILTGFPTVYRCWDNTVTVTIYRPQYLYHCFT